MLDNTTVIIGFLQENQTIVNEIMTGAGNESMPSWVQFCGNTAPMAAIVVFLAVGISCVLAFLCRYFSFSLSFFFRLLSHFLPFNKLLKIDPWAVCRCCLIRP